MASSTVRTYKQYLYSVAASIHFGSNDIVDIDPMLITSLVVDYDYDNNNFPLVYLTLNIESRILDRMIKTKNTTTIVLTVKKAIENSSNKIWAIYFEDRFAYIIPDDINKNDSIEYNEETKKQNNPMNYKRNISLGLVSLNLLNTNKNVSPINGAVSGTMQTIVYYTLSNQRALLIEPFNHNPDIRNMIIPPLNSCSKVIEYLNNKSSFYNSKYLYFQDFDCTYLLSTSGVFTKKKGEKYNDVLLNTIVENNIVTKTQGMSEDSKNNMYYIPFSADEVRVADYHDIDKEFVNINAVDTDGNLISKKVIENHGVFSSKSQNVRIYNENPYIVDNMSSGIKEQTTVLSVNTTYLDSSVLTPNKRYKFEGSQVYSSTDYNGVYRLSRKRELYIRIDDSYFMSTQLFLKKK